MAEPTTVLEHLLAAKQIAKTHGDHEMGGYLKKLIDWATGRIASPETKKGESA